MSNLTSILGTDNISLAPSVLTGNFQKLNEDKVETSVLSGSYITSSTISANFLARPVVASQLGSGTASANTFLRGDLTWSAQTGGNTTFIPASSGSHDAGSSVVAAAGSAFVPVVKVGEATTKINVTALMPDGFSGISSVKAVIIGDNTGGNIDLDFVTARVPVACIFSAPITTDTNAPGSVIGIPASSSVLVIDFPSSAYNGISPQPNEVVAVSFQRNGASANDTHNTTLDVLGIVINWQ